MRESLFLSDFDRCFRLADESEDRLGRLIRLGEHRGSGLLQDVEAGELRAFG
ncbi:MAG: hypothetical protein RL630_1894, partial [Verrucomicrobiota bacterium]